jgi:cobalt-zinc-cadmium efflux system outer membrane protein
MSKSLPASKRSRAVERTRPRFATLRNRGPAFHSGLRRHPAPWPALVLCLVLAGPASAQEPGLQHGANVTSLADLLREAARDNPQVLAARQEWMAAQQVPTQASALPDPEFQIQQLSVGSPRPFAGYTNSDFAYIGVGISQDFPYPGKRQLKAGVARRDAEALGERYESVRRAVLARVKTAYFDLAYHAKILAVLDSDGALLELVEKAAEARYRSGMGNQQDVLQAQLERTKLLGETTLHHLEVAKLEARLKELVNRSPSAPDIAVTDLVETPLAYTYEQLLAASQAQNPQIAGARDMVDRQRLQVDLARKDFYPDFSVQYMWQRTDPARFRAYYMLTVGVRVPIYRRRKQRPELAQAEAELRRSRSELQAESQQVASELRIEYDTVQSTAQLLRIYREGLLPQARAEFQAAVAAYESNRQDFQALLASFLDVLRLDEAYWQSVAERETAIARLEELSGLPLEEKGAPK